jgi:hypothetical protein
VPEEAKWRIFIENLTPEEFFTRRELLFWQFSQEKIISKVGFRRAQRKL